jgi:hypothetical protein
VLNRSKDQTKTIKKHQIMDQNPKQQVAEKLRNSANVLITVSKNPNVDQLAAAIGLSLMLDSLGKHTATVFSGQIPDILKFLEPEKTFDSNVDGLRDFIISLDKEKADKLRYKVEDDVVKVYITPYRSKITESDLTFTQGDFNVDVVIALGVKKKADLDEAITAHGRILHDATVVAVNAGDVGGDVGSIDWTDPNANSLCEMLVSISEALEGGILDGAMSTALLTGIVSVTERFSNEKTTPKLMTMAAQLMAAGANQQLISKELQLGSFAAGAAGSNKKDETMIDLHESKKSKDNDQEKHDTPAKEMIEPESEPEFDIKNNVSDDVKLDELEKQLQKTGDELEKPALELPSVEVPSKPADSLADGGIIAHGSSGLAGTFSATTDEAVHKKQDEHKDAINDEALAPEVQPIVENPVPEVSPQQEDESTDSAGAEEKAIEDARRAVEQAAVQASFNPAGNPLTALNSQPMSDDVSGQINHDPVQASTEIPPLATTPPSTPPPMPPPMPPAMSTPPAMDLPSPSASPAPQTFSPPPAPSFDPNHNAAAQTFNIPPPPQDDGQLPPPPPPLQ